MVRQSPIKVMMLTPYKTSTICLRCRASRAMAMIHQSNSIPNFVTESKFRPEYWKGDSGQISICLSIPVHARACCTRRISMAHTLLCSSSTIWLELQSSCCISHAEEAVSMVIAKIHGRELTFLKRTHNRSSTGNVWLVYQILAYSRHLCLTTFQSRCILLFAFVENLCRRLLGRSNYQLASPLRRGRNFQRRQTTI